MGFKSDREFLRNVSIGAVGTRKIAAILRQGGFCIIELERYCSSNKIWATKIKRLRVPDLLCLDSGIRIACRAKADLKITMSHSVNNVDRAWDKGLRDSDIVAFIRCWPTDDTWKASDRAALFRVGDMRFTWHLAKQERMKSAAEGSEVRVTWPATVANRAGKVLSVSPDSIRRELASGRQQSYRLARESSSGSFRLMPHVNAGDVFGDGDTILASALPAMLSPSPRRRRWRSLPENPAMPVSGRRWPLHDLRSASEGLRRVSPHAEERVCRPRPSSRREHPVLPRRVLDRRATSGVAVPIEAGLRR